MRIKRFEAPDTRTALAMVKEELGEDAVILANRSMAAKKDGGGKFSGRRYVEVVAALDDDLQRLASTAALFEQKDDPLHGALGVGCEKRSPDRKEQPRRAPVLEGRSHAVDSASLPEKAVKGGSSSHSRALAGQGLASYLKSIGARKPRDGGAGKIPDGLAEARAVPRMEGGKPSPEDIARWRDELIGRIVVEPLKLDTFRDGPTVIALVGPTGVGKTTTAAKLAAWFTLREGRKATLLSMDCYRIGATDQLRTYARLMRLPCEIVLKKNDLKSAIARHWDQDLIIVDTAGKSPYDERHVEELAEWFAIDAPVTPYLVLSATKKREDLNHLVESYRALAVKGLVVTKLDETRAYAALCQCLAMAGLPVACLCTGQRVPEDFLMASRVFLETLFKKGWQRAMALSKPGSIAA